MPWDMLLTQALLAADDAAAAARRAGRRAGEYAHITQDMLKDGGYFDMPIQVPSASGSCFGQRLQLPLPPAESPCSAPAQRPDHNSAPRLSQPNDPATDCCRRRLRS